MTKTEAMRSTKAELHKELRQRDRHIKHLLGELDRFAAVEGDVNFGVDPKDSSELLKLRTLIDDHLPFPSERAEERGDYGAAIRHAARLVRKVKR